MDGSLKSFSPQVRKENDMSRAEEAWREYIEPMPDFQRLRRDGPSFLAGYTRGRADAWQLPEVRAEELEEGKYYFAQWGKDEDENWTVIRVSKWREGNIALWITGDECEVDVCYFQRFRGPLPLGGE